MIEIEVQIEIRILINLEQVGNKECTKTHTTIQTGPWLKAVSLLTTNLSHLAKIATLEMNEDQVQVELIAPQEEAEFIKEFQGDHIGKDKDKSQVFLKTQFVSLRLSLMEVKMSNILKSTRVKILKILYTLLVRNSILVIMPKIGFWSRFKIKSHTDQYE